MSCITLTFGNRAENHIGNECIGSKDVLDGLNLQDFEQVKNKLGDCVEILDLKQLLVNSVDEKTFNNIENAYLLVIRNGVNILTEKTNEIKKELMSKEVDKKYYDTKQKKIKNKLARHNYCISDFERLLPNYECGEGRVYNFDDMEYTKELRNKIGIIFGKNCVGLQGEINLYYNVKKCGIGYHGDKEREIVIGARFGETFPIAFNWFDRNKVIGEKLVINLNDGDIYAMSEKTVGKDWLKSSLYTLRHSAGCDKYINSK